MVDMKRIRKIGLCLGIAFALGAFGAVSAMALPDFVPKNGFPVKFKGTSGASTLETTGKNTISCTSLSTLGAWLATMLADVHFVFHGCTSKGFFGETANCTTPGASTGLILTKLLLAHLYYIKKEAKPPVGVLVLPLTGKVQAEFKCNTFPEAKVVVEGEVVGEIPATNAKGEKQLNEAKSSLELNFKQTGGKQEIQTVLLLATLLEAGFMEKVHLTSKVEGIETSESGETGSGSATLEPAGETAEIQA
jgi:hypothetical protein